MPTTRFRPATPYAARPRALPLVLSVHGHDVYGDGPAMPAVPATLAHARLVMANSAGTARRCEANGAGRTRVVHLGTDLPDAGSARPPAPTLVTVGHLVARKRHADVIAALARLRARDRTIRYVVVGDGPERERLRTQAAALGVADAVEFRGRLPHDRAVATAQAASLFVMPSIDEAFGVAYVEAMAAGVPAVGCAGEDGPTEIAAAGGGIALVAPRDPRGLARDDRGAHQRSGKARGGRARGARDGRSLIHVAALRPRYGGRLRGGAAPVGDTRSGGRSAGSALLVSPPCRLLPRRSAAARHPPARRRGRPI